MTLEAYVALDEQRALRVQNSSKLVPAMFGKPFQNVPLKRSPEAACEAVMRSTQCPPRVATEATEWCLLKLTFNAEQVCEAFKDCRLTYGRDANTWAWYGELSIDDLSFEWWKLTIAPIGMPAWAEKALTGDQVGTSIACAGCGSDCVPTWKSNPKHGQTDYCASCWHGYFVERWDQLIVKQSTEEPEK